MTLCKFFQQGYCKNGNNCRFEHPNANSNRFSAFGGGGGASNNRNTKELPFNLSKETIQLDLTTEKPQWILSSYGPGRDAPEQLFGGFPREQSFEEVRLVYEEGVLMGNPQGALSQIEGIYRDADNQIQNALQNLDGAVEYIISAQNKNPNRLSVVQNNTNGTFAVGRQQQTNNPFGAPKPFGAAAGGTPGGFGQPSAASTGGFGQPSTLGQTPSPFGAPAFGQPAKPAGGFGQPSTLGSGQGAFGQPSALGGTPSAFGQPSTLGGTSSAFGQASALGQKPSPFGTPAFGQASQPSAAAPSGFGQPSAAAAPAFGQPSQPAPAFGSATPMGGNSGFGQPSTLGQKPNPFGAPSTTNGNAFGAANAGPSPFGQTNNASPFAQAASTNSAPNAFGQPSKLNSGFGQASASPFGQAPSAGPFGAPPAQPSSAPEQSMDMSGPPATPAATSAPFAQPSAAANNNPFGQPSQPASNPFGQAPAASNPFGAAQPAAASAPDGPSPYAPGATRQHPAASSYITKNPNGTLNTFKGKSVSYETPKAGAAETAPFPAIRNFDGSVTRIWNPNGPPTYYSDTEAAPEAYDAATRAAWEPFINTGRFQNATIPEVPPLREWCTWDF
ncbi:hypothetical protein ACKVV1_006328 [Pyricularia oryzae]